MEKKHNIVLPLILGTVISSTAAQATIQPNHLSEFRSSHSFIQNKISKLKSSSFNTQRDFGGEIGYSKHEKFTCHAKCSQ